MIFFVRYDIAGCLREAGYAVIEIASGEESHPAPFGDGQSLFWKVDAWLFHLFFGKRLKTILTLALVGHALEATCDNTGRDAYSQFLHSSLHS